MIRLEVKDYNTTSGEKQKKYQIFHHVKLINKNILQLKKYYFLIKVE